MCDPYEVKVTLKKHQPTYVKCKLCSRAVMLFSNRANRYEKYFKCKRFETICDWCSPNFGKYSGYDETLAGDSNYVYTFMNKALIDNLKWLIRIKKDNPKRDFKDLWAGFDYYY